MSVIFVILGFVLICLILVHINLHQKKKELYNFIESVNKTLVTRHKKIAKLVNMIGETELTREIKNLNMETIEKIQKNEMKPSQAVRAEVLLEDKMYQLLRMLKDKELTDEVKEAIESYKRTQKKVNKNKKKYNEMMQEFLEACHIEPAPWYAAFEQIDTDFPRLSAISE